MKKKRIYTAYCPVRSEVAHAKGRGDGTAVRVRNVDPRQVALR